jgi:hypothetical protein
MADNRDPDGISAAGIPAAGIPAAGRHNQPLTALPAAKDLQVTQDHHRQPAAHTRPKAPPSDGADRTIVVRDRRKPNQYTTNNIIAREWLPILRVGDAFFFYSIYLSMANRETESSWGSLRTQAKYLQCGVDLIIRGNRLLEICELIYIDTGNYRTTNEYYILEPPPLTLNRSASRLAGIDPCPAFGPSGAAAEEAARSRPSTRRRLRANKRLPACQERRRGRTVCVSHKHACQVAWTSVLVTHNQGWRGPQRG